MIVEPSHTSMALQVADLGINRFIKKPYECEYTSSMCTTALTKSKFGVAERIAWILQVVQAQHAENQLIANSFGKCGLLAVYNEVVRYFPTNCFRAGTSQCDPNLPGFSAFYIRNVSSLENYLHRETLLLLFLSLLFRHVSAVLNIVSQLDEAFIVSIFAIRATAQVEDNSSLEKRTLTGINTADEVVDRV